MKKHIDDPIDILGDAYESMYENTAKEFHKAEEKTTPVLHGLIDKAKQEVIEAEKISQQDADKLAEYLKRDLADFINHLSQTGKELKDWLGFEATFLETELFDYLLNAADPTTVELTKLKLETTPAPVYHTGEITSPGTLICDHCGEKLHFYKTGKIPPCPKCKTTDFHRQTGM